jgi:myo-inositol-1(or 4)-monophosphatase
MTSVGTAELLELARSVAVEAGELAARMRAEGVEVANTKSSAVDVVTLADKATELFIRDALAKARPDDGFLGEESDGSSGSSGLTWIVDPIDGTVNYLYGIPQWAVSIAVVEGEPDPETWNAVAGCVASPATREVFTASRGGGAFVGDRMLQVATGVDLSQALLGTGFGYLSEIREKQGEVLAAIVGQVRDIRRIGSASLDLCYLAAGRIDAYAERGLNPWDHAAGALIAREAGARVSGFGADRESSRFLLAAEESLAARLEPILFDLYQKAGL